MNIIFGIWRSDGPAITREELESMAANTRRFSADGEWYTIRPEIGLGQQVQYTHPRSRMEGQPAPEINKTLLAYDGRLDNYRDLVRDLDLTKQEATDSEVILRAYERWGTNCFARFVGDWSVALWDGTEHALYLARDHAGTRTLHYVRTSAGTVMWSTYLDSFLGTELLEAPDDTYIAAYMAMAPNYCRTPYKAIRSVLPGHFYKITVHGVTTVQFWTPMAHERILYKSERDYDVHFLALLEQAVERRSEQGGPIVAHLSGGMDSTAIVCVSDKLRRASGRDAELLDTLSFFDDSDPNWNERPYFTLVETFRGKTGLHVDASSSRSTYKKSPSDWGNYLFPGTDPGGVRWERRLLETMAPKGYRVILSGIGGDELTGGVPDIIPELADHIVAARISSAAKLSVAWCLSARICLGAAGRATWRFFNDYLRSTHASDQVPPWFTERTRQLCDDSANELPIDAYRPLKAYPSAVANCWSWWRMLRTQPHLRPSEVFRYEHRYPFLDRDLDDFLFRVPPGVLLRPGRRRALMRRALVDIVPQEILERRRKAFLLKTEVDNVRALAPKIERLADNAILEQLGFIKGAPLRSALQDTISGKDLRWWPQILRTVATESWLRCQFKLNAAATFEKVPVGDRFLPVSTEQVPL